SRARLGSDSPEADYPAGRGSFPRLPHRGVGERPAPAGRAAVDHHPAAFSPDGSRIVTAGEVARVWDARTGAELFALKGNRGRIYSTSFSPDGARIVTGGTVRLWGVRPTKRT